MNLKTTRVKLGAFLTRHPARFFLVAALLWMTLMYFLNQKEKIQWDDILIEANGMAFDLLVFGILLSVYEVLREKRDKIERLHEEIDDYRGWNEKEATFRIVGAVRRLKNLKISRINFSLCYLEGAELTSMPLLRSYFVMSKCANIRMGSANLKGLIVIESDFTGATFINSNLEGCIFQRSNLKDVNFKGVTIGDLEIQGAYLNNAAFEDNDLEGAIVGKDWFEKLEKWNVKGAKEIIEKYYIDGNEKLQIKQ